jgi:transposase-like protein
MTTERRGRGRPSIYGRQASDAVLEHIIAGAASIAAACRAAGVNVATFSLWVRKDRDGMADRFARARRLQALW